MNAMTCAALRNAAGELALDLLSGEERAAALAHLESCASCRQEVSQLTDVAEELLLLAPDVEPSAEFEQRVLTRIEELAAPAPATSTPGWRSIPRRVLAVAAAVVVVVAAAGILVTTLSNAPEAAARTAEMRGEGGEVVGDVSLTADPASLIVTITDWVGLVHSYDATVDAPYWLAVETADGSRDLHRLPPADQQPWDVDIETNPNTVVAVSVVDNGGTVWCIARFTQ